MPIKVDKGWSWKLALNVRFKDSWRRGVTGAGTKGEERKQLEE